jgi:tetratricopeptide (TPR) repeat protein
MRKVAFFCLAFLIAGVTYAQKGSVSKASSYLSKEDYASAKAEIDVAITIEKNAGKSKTWFERGRIYQAIATSDDEAVSSLDNKAIEKAVEAYEKVIEMEKENAPNAVLSSTNIDAMWGKFINDGGTIYAEDKYEAAYDKFIDALKVKPQDSLTLLYSGVCAQQAEDYENTAKHYYKLEELGYASVDAYSTLIYIERAVNKDEEKALEVVKRAQAKYPTEPRFGEDEISILINLKKLDQAKNKLIESIKEDPNNVNLHLNLAIMYDNIASNMSDNGEPKEKVQETYNNALQEYLKVIELEPENYVANYNAGAIYINQAKEYYDQVRDMDLSLYNKKGPALTKKADEILVKGLPYMEKANESKEDVDGLRALMQMYKQLKMYDKAEAVLSKVEELEAAQ